MVYACWLTLSNCVFDTLKVHFAGIYLCLYSLKVLGNDRRLYYIINMCVCSH